jgi:hypothetical protein
MRRRDAHQPARRVAPHGARVRGALRGRRGLRRHSGQGVGDGRAAAQPGGAGEEGGQLAARHHLVGAEVLRIEAAERDVGGGEGGGGVVIRLRRHIHEAVAGPQRRGDQRQQEHQGHAKAAPAAPPAPPRTPLAQDGNLGPQLVQLPPREQPSSDSIRMGVSLR